MVWLVLIRKSGVFKLHSAHTLAETAEHWRKCKEFDGDDTEIAVLDNNGVEELTDTLNKLEKQ